MSIKTLDKKLVRDLMQMRGQVLTIGLVVACGVASLVAAMSTYDSLQWMQASYYHESHFAHVFASLKRAPLALQAKIVALPGVAEAEMRVVYDVTLDIPEVAAPAVGRMIALPKSGAPRLNQLHLRRGRLPNPERPEEILINEAFAKAHRFTPDDTLRALINGKYQTLRIVGVALSPEYVFAIRGGVPDDRQFGIIRINHDALTAAFNMEGAFNDVVLRLAPGASRRQVIEHLDELLTPYGSLGAFGRSEQLSHRFLTDEIKQQGTMATTIPPIFVAVAAFLLNVVLTRVVSIQREQIATLKALGYSNRTVALHYMKLVALITLAGIGLGIVLGSGLGRLMTANYVTFFHFPVFLFRVQPWIPLLAGGVTLAAALLAALNAIRRVVWLAPAEAMRPPAPRAYRGSFLERSGLMRALSPQGRMVVRSITSRPLRAFFTVLGIALALPITILGLFWHDAMAHLITMQFTMIDRSDAIVVFTDPVIDRARREIARLPGVMQAEAFRTVPVRLRAGHRSYRTDIMGIGQGAELRRLLDAEQRSIPLPPDGLLLTDRLGERLGVKAGDTITVEVLEGERARRDIVVQAMVNELMGLSAYMELRALRRFLREGETISAVSMAVEAVRANEVYTQLKALPKVVTVSVKAVALQSFKDTTATFVLVFTGILTVFAVIIAIGIVYNNARITLAERAWELASLRVLGFTQGEVSRLLLAELSLEILVAIPLGWWLGYQFVAAILAEHQTEMFRIPPIISARSYALATLAIMVSAIVSALIVRRRIDHLDLVEVLKTHE
ncbi:ABC transporter permease [Candidatus Entotheonella palauensis]|uniref:ABC transporter permease n=1 Tax=Candidatus Entotheonella palauensis TaxID=93172 RepID=UPI0015C43305|nr:ABC transporter permease [Candidatus Entotheonella palauensis]